MILSLSVTYHQNIFQGRLEKVSQLLLGNQFEQRWLQWVASDVVEEFHGCDFGEHMTIIITK